jgi:hypothetical protein
MALCCAPFMRWKFPDPSEEQVRRLAIDRIDAFWRAFEGRAGELDALFQGRGHFDLPAWMDSLVGLLQPRLGWEFSPARDGGHRLVLSPGPRLRLRPFADEVLARAPSLPGWSFGGHREVCAPDEARALVKARTGYDLASFRARAMPGEHHLIDLTFTSPAFHGRTDTDALGAAHLAAEALLGEAEKRRWVGKLAVARGGMSERSRPLDELPARFETLQKATIEGLPGPCFSLARDARWSLFHLDPGRHAVYPGQSDLLVGTSMLPEMWRCAHAPGRFSSSRFSRSGELFCHLKVDAEGGLDTGVFRDRADLEHALDSALVADRLGCVVGGGTGLRHVYVDLALAQPEAALERAARVLREGDAPLRSWFLFFDDELRDEWVSVWPGGPLPPGFAPPAV